jgi:hypothetical protein
MEVSALDIYAGPVAALSAREKLRLASLILAELDQSDYAAKASLEWSAEDRMEVAARAFDYADERYPEEDDLV